MNVLKFSIIVLFLATLPINALNANPCQNTKVITSEGVYDGYDVNDGYAFVIAEDLNDDEDTTIIYFSDLKEGLLKTLNLKSKEWVGKRFEITYEVTTYEEIDENGDAEIYEDYKIVALKHIK
ncbi:hypothetical protein [Winogradskyella arenosi]|uniref:Uncharacterized protein n=1 Tax=Winogradskyella arenosi TaxID=533325 RepID=A0A368ZBZ8_9FLAO|nr:hypothetical protein [Winogradskyella arenosi]RCW90388.1 hypothetical protein DFQ08_105280 [Winogradskyella arenosi]